MFLNIDNLLPPPEILSTPLSPSSTPDNRPIWTLSQSESQEYVDGAVNEITLGYVQLLRSGGRSIGIDSPDFYDPALTLQRETVLLAQVLLLKDLELEASRLRDLILSTRVDPALGNTVLSQRFCFCCSLR